MSATVLVLTVGACNPNSPTISTSTSTTESIATATASAPRSSGTPSAAGAPQAFGVDVVDRVPYDRSFSQGLDYLDARLMESVGGDGSSALREFASDGSVLRTVAGDPSLFATGLASIPAQPVPATGLWQLSWQNHVAILRDPTTLSEVRRVAFDGEGWGLCADGGRLVQSRGDNHLLLRDQASFAVLGEVVVTGQWSTSRLGELECVVFDGRPQVWANPQGTDWLLRIDPASGSVTGVANLGRLAVEEMPTQVEQVLGGLAAIPQTENEFWVAGRGWGHRYRIRLVPRS